METHEVGRRIRWCPDDGALVMAPHQILRITHHDVDSSDSDLE